MSFTEATATKADSSANAVSLSPSQRSYLGWDLTALTAFLSDRTGPKGCTERPSGRSATLRLEWTSLYPKNYWETHQDTKGEADIQVPHLSIDFARQDGGECWSTCVYPSTSALSFSGSRLDVTPLLQGGMIMYSADGLQVTSLTFIKAEEQSDMDQVTPCAEGKVEVVTRNAP